MERRLAQAQEQMLQLEKELQKSEEQRTASERQAAEQQLRIEAERSKAEASMRAKYQRIYEANVAELSTKKASYETFRSQKELEAEEAKSQLLQARETHAQELYQFEQQLRGATQELDEVRQRLRIKDAEASKAMADSRQMSAKTASLQARLKALELDLGTEKKSAQERLAAVELTFQKEKIAWEQELEGTRLRLNTAHAELQQLRAVKLEHDRRAMAHLQELQDSLTSELSRLFRKEIDSIAQG
eukprot:scaffold300_cov258-Pinguiococcus_pyrenoidosus.AAC.42